MCTYHRKKTKMCACCHDGQWEEWLKGEGEPVGVLGG